MDHQQVMESNNELHQHAGAAQDSTSRIPNAPLPTDSNAISVHSHQSKSNLGRLSLVASIVLAATSLSIPNLPFMTNATTNLPFYVIYGIIAVLSLVSVLLLGVRSFHKLPYPNIAGLVGTVLGILVLYNVASVLFIFVTSGNN
jgi:hypothetical protein